MVALVPVVTTVIGVVIGIAYFLTVEKSASKTHNDLNGGTKVSNGMLNVRIIEKKVDTEHS